MKSIKTKLILSYSILILTVTAIIGSITLVTGYTSLKKEAENSLQLLAAESSKLVESRMDSLITTLSMIAKKHEIENMGWEVDTSALKEELEKTDFLDIGYVLPNGYTYYTDGTVRLMSDRNYVQDALEGKARISDVVISRVTRKPEIEIAVPVLLDGNIVGALVARKEADSLSEITKDIGYGKNGYAFMINEQGTIIAHPDTEEVISRYNPIEEAKKNHSLSSLANTFTRILKDKAGIVSYQYDGKNLYSGFAPVEGTNWSFVITADKDEIMSAIPKLVQRIITVMLIILLCSIGIVYLLDIRLTRPLIELTKHSKRIGELDISENVTENFLMQKDEIGALSGAFQILTDNLREIILELSRSAVEVSDTSQELSVASEQSALVSEDISHTAEEIAKGAMEQAGNTEEGLAQATLLEQKIEINHQHMIKLNGATEQVTNDVNEGLKVIEKLMVMTNQNDQATKNIREVILQMKKSSEQINDASRVISDMAKQTNLLALNASIEAARAGDAGKGFAVVAEEIKNMADQSAKSTKYIDQIVNQLQENIRVSVESMERISITSDGQRKSVSDTIQKYHNISEANKKSEAAVKELNCSEKDMISANNEIKSMLQSLSAIAEQNAAGMQQSVSTMEEQAASAQVIAGVCDRLNGLSEKLRVTVTKFRL